MTEIPSDFLLCELMAPDTNKIEAKKSIIAIVDVEAFPFIHIWLAITVLPLKKSKIVCEKLEAITMPM